MTGFEMPSANPKGSALRPFAITARAGEVSDFTSLSPCMPTWVRMAWSQSASVIP